MKNIENINFINKNEDFKSIEFDKYFYLSKIINNLNKLSEYIKNINIKDFRQKLSITYPVAMGIFVLYIFFYYKTEKHGNNNFSDDNINKQREWLIDWISDRNDIEGYSEEDLNIFKNKMIENINNLSKIGHERMGLGLGGEYHSSISGDNDFIKFNTREDNNKNFIYTPLHEISHASNKGGAELPNQFKELIDKSIKTQEDYVDFVSNDSFAINLPEKERRKSTKIADPKKYYDYIKEPTEFFSFLMELRCELNLDPRKKITKEEVEKIYKLYKNEELKLLGSKNILEIIKSPEDLMNILNGIVDVNYLENNKSNFC